MRDYVIPPPAQPAIPVVGGGWFPVRRIFCIGQNYLADVKELIGDHVKETDDETKSSLPVVFTKPADSICLGGNIPLPLATDNLHYEGELVVAMKDGGSNLSPSAAEEMIYGFAVGCDLTRRDLQEVAKELSGPWDMAKAIDNGAVVGGVMPEKEFWALEEARLMLSVNNDVRQAEDLKAMIKPVWNIISDISRYFEVKAGDLIFTGTPSGVGQLVPGDKVRIGINDLAPVEFWISET
ncbi:fumarylacetoacetate hydrolase family protein [Parvularcula sp. IMCC14364]|uniref:fumarylacetoacetate hydrolase family protein n=1 Tax=Parvularcula sp. IMCC14364 TaxID=3067902 RepID=UPI002741C3C0|nr:fumarylacetoacetate hydrolase family protein [Parvularcula sp. IMCC14364]